MNTRIGNLAVSYGGRGVPSYQLELWHDGLRKHRVIKGREQEIVRRKADMQIAEWNERWTQVSARNQYRLSKEEIKSHQESAKRQAAERTSEAQLELDRLHSILRQTLGVNDAIIWEDLKDKQPFPEAPPGKPEQPPKPRAQSRPSEPKPSDPQFQAALGFFDKLIASRRQRIDAEAQGKFQAAHAEWKREVRRIENANVAAEASYETRLLESERAHEALVGGWEERRNAFLQRQQIGSEAVDRQRDQYMACIPDAIVDYCDLVLSLSDYPGYFPQEYALDYNPESKLIVVEYAFPAPQQIPTLKEVKYIASRDEFTEQPVPAFQQTKTYDDLLYQIALRTVHELFEADVVNAIETIVFNGIVTSIDRSSGKEVTACVLSLQAGRTEFMAINLANVDPKACFKALKGVGSSKLHSLAAVPPIMQMRREDGRFISAYEVANTLDESSNLAAMDWEDFEHLIREVFEKEFSSSGGEVRVTQASRDGGVDAVAFDPDPIRGGKIVIQAKRYTNTVGVGAVRDLYGTLMNEGANKGILVTTSDYGPDAYSFANGKPLVLLNGANLLHMLQKHGHRAKIDLQEAHRAAMGKQDE